MEQKINYRLEQEKIIKTLDTGKPPKLLLHSCCAPCSSAVLEYLSEYFEITVFYFNPNIYPEEEFLHRISEQKRLIAELPCKNKVSFIEHGWQSERFYEAVKGLEYMREGGERCFACYRLRLEETAKLAVENGFDYFTTTLSVSPYKNARKLNETGEELSEIYGVKHLPSDFKKKDGYKRSIELSEKYGLYRQNYCGCVFSKREREASNPEEKLPEFLPLDIIESLEEDYARTEPYTEEQMNDLEFDSDEWYSDGALAYLAKETLEAFGLI